MKRVLFLCLMFALVGVFSAVRAENRVTGAQGQNEVLAVVNGKSITYQTILNDIDIEAEVNTMRTTRGIPNSVPDKDIETQIVYQRLETIVFQRMLEAEAKSIQLIVTKAQMRGIIEREKRDIGIAKNDNKKWAKYLKEQYGLAPNEYLDKRRKEALRQEMLWMMAGARGDLPAQHPISVFFSLRITPRDVRLQFEKEKEKYRVAKEIDYQQFKVLYPEDVGLDVKRKIFDLVSDPERGVYARVKNGESIEAASDGLRTLIKEMGTPGVRVEVSKRQTAKDDSEMDSTTYLMVLSVSPTGGISELGSLHETNEEEATKYEGVTFIKLYSRKDGIKRDFNSPKVQESIRDSLWTKRFQINQLRVQRALLKKAAIVPEHLVGR